jgi:hypothetical protein
MTQRTVYATGFDPSAYTTSEQFGIRFNDAGHTVAIGAGEDGRFGIYIVGKGHGYAKVTREELAEIRDAINRELETTP